MAQNLKDFLKGLNKSGWKPALPARATEGIEKTRIFNRHPALPTRATEGIGKTRIFNRHPALPARATEVFSAGGKPQGGI